MFFSFPRRLGSLGSAGGSVAGKINPMGRFSGGTSRGGTGTQVWAVRSPRSHPNPTRGSEEISCARSRWDRGAQPREGAGAELASHCLSLCLSLPVIHRRSAGTLLAGAWMSRELLSRLGMFQRLLLLIPPGKVRRSRVLRCSCIHPFPAKLPPAAQGALLGHPRALLLLFSLSPYALAPNLHQPEARKGL